MKKVFKLSFLIPSYNSLDTLSECLSPLLSYAKETGSEVLVADDGSSDGTWNYLQTLPVKSLKNSQNRGVAFTRNKLAAAAEGEILFFIDADVIIDVETIKKSLEKFLSLKDGSALGLATAAEDPSGNWQACLSCYRSHLPTFLMTHDIQRCSGLRSDCTLIWKSDFQKIGGFKEDYLDAGMEEFEFGHRMEEMGMKNYVSKSLQIRSFHKPFFKRCHIIFKRTQLWPELLLKRKKIESLGTAGNPQECLSCMTTFLLIFSLFLPVGLRGECFLFLLGLHFLIERKYIFLCLKGRGMTFTLSAYLAIHFFNISAAFGALLGSFNLLKKPWRRELKESL